MTEIHVLSFLIGFLVGFTGLIFFGLWTFGILRRNIEEGKPERDGLEKPESMAFAITCLVISAIILWLVV